MTAQTRIGCKLLAEEFGIDPRTASRILKEAGVPLVKGSYNAARARKAVEDGSDPSLLAGHALAGRGDVTLPAVNVLSAARARSETARAKKVELAIEIQEGRLVDRASADFHIRDLIRRIVAGFEGLGTKLAPRLVNQTDQRAIAELIGGDVALVLHDLSDIDKVIDEALA